MNKLIILILAVSIMLPLSLFGEDIFWLILSLESQRLCPGEHFYWDCFNHAKDNDFIMFGNAYFNLALVSGITIIMSIVMFCAGIYVATLSKEIIKENKKN